MKITPQLRYVEVEVRQAGAWLILGDDPRVWLAEMTTWGVPLAEARLFPLPENVASTLRVPSLAIDERTPADGTRSVPATLIGVVVVLPGEKELAPTGNAIPFVRLSERLLAPLDGRLDPPLDHAELAALVPPDAATYVWHPTAGLLRYDRASAWRVSDLISAPRLGPTKWDAAQPGTAINQRLLSIEPLVRPTLADVMQAGRGEIGSSPLRGSTLPPAPGEPRGGSLGARVQAAGMVAAAMGAGALAAAAGAVSSALGAFGAGLAGGGQASGGRKSPKESAGKSGPSWIERLNNWARQQQQAAAQNLERLRNRQVERLLNMLQQSPDDGLKFALPVAGDAAHRGLAPPSAHLVERQVNFSLSGLGGGRAADFWDLPQELRLRLMQRYRELANREITLGRHRRAAYILAELLGDLTSAAATLADGGHFREAAVLYEERLKLPLRAAQCLSQGGLWTEAIAIYERLGTWETAGDLYLQLDRPEEAAQCYRRVVRAYLETGDHLAAAKLLETKLDAPEAAYETLLGGWPATPQAQKCLDEAFALLARHKRHDQAARQLAQFREQDTSATLIAPLASCLARVATTYPHSDIQFEASDFTRSLVSRRLPDAPLAESAGLLQSLASLAPADRLLSRDCHRYRDLREADDRRRRIVPYSPRRGGARLVSSFQLPAAEWKTAVASFGDLFAAGFEGSNLVLVRAHWSGVWQRIGETPWRANLATPAILLADDPAGNGKLYVACGPGIPDTDRTFPASDTFLTPLVAGPHRGVSERTLAIHYGMGGNMLVVNLGSEGFVEVNVYSNHGALAMTLTIAFGTAEMAGLTNPTPFYARGQHLYLGVGSKLFSRHLDQRSTTLHAPVRHITGPPTAARARIVVGCEQGGVVLWGESASSPESTFAMDLVNPVVGLSRAGHLVAATAESIEVFDTGNGTLAFLGEIPGPKNTPIAVLPTNNPARFAVCTEIGTVNIYEAGGK